MLALVLVVLAAVAARSDAADERLYYAARDGRTKVLQRLLGEEGVLPDTPHESGMTALMWAASTGEAGAIAALLEGGADPNVRMTYGGASALSIAAEHHHVEAVKALLAGGASVDMRQDDGQTALMLAAEAGDHREALTVITLLEAGANPLLRTEDGWFFAGDTAKRLAERYGHEQAAELLAKAEAQWLLRQDHAPTEL